MFQDPIIKEIRKIRHDIETEYQNDSQKYYEHLEQLQKKYQDRIVRRKPVVGVRS